MAGVEFRQVSFGHARGAQVLDRFTLGVAAGETVALVGTSGAGKTTVLKLVNRLLLPDAGEVRVQGRSTREWDAIRLRRSIGYVIQDVGLFPHLTVADNIAVVPRLERWDDARVSARVRELLGLIGLAPDEYGGRWPDELSGGQRQRVGVARALAADPPVLLMDEPFGALDPVTRRQLQGEFRRIQARLRKTVLIVTHDMAEAIALADRIGVLDAGRLIWSGPARSILEADDARVRRLRRGRHRQPARRERGRLMDLVRFWLAHQQELATLAGQHVLLVTVSSAMAVAIGVPLGIFAARRPRLASPLVGIANVVQTVPSLAMFGFLLPVPFVGGIGARAAIAVLVLYALLPIVRSTIVGITGVDRSVREAGVAMGMTAGELLRRVELPLALPSIVAGVRVASVVGVGSATIAAAIGAGGLGQYIYRGLSMVDTTVILAGAIPAALLALGVDGGLLWLERRLSPRGRRASGRKALAVAAGLAAVLLAGSGALAARASGAIVVGSKNFTEQVVLGEIVAQTIERETGLPVQRQLNLGGTLICDRALGTGDIDVYVEYTGTALTAIFRQPPSTDREAVMRTVRAALRGQRTHAAAAARLRQHLRHPGARRRRPCARPAHDRRRGAAGAAVARRLRLRVPRASRRLPGPGQGLRPDLPRTATSDGPGPDLSRPRLRAGRRDRRRRHRRADRQPRSRPARGRPALLPALRCRAGGAGRHAAAVSARAGGLAAPGAAHLGGGHARDEPGRGRAAREPGGRGASLPRQTAVGWGEGIP